MRKVIFIEDFAGVTKGTEMECDSQHASYLVTQDKVAKYVEVAEPTEPTEPKATKAKQTK
jgi:hypothetical protein